VRVLKAIIVENDENVIRFLREFESDNAVLFSIIELVSDFKNIIELTNLHKPDVLIVGFDDVPSDAKILNELNVRRPKLLYLSKNKCDAYEAFIQNATNFILKPINTNSLIVSIYKIIKFIEMETVYQNDVIGKIKTINTLHQNFEYVSIASVDKIELLKVKDIVFCKADGKYTEFYTIQNSKILSSKNLGEYVPQLGNNFFRIHHSYIINIDFLIKIVKKNGLFCELANGHILPVAKRRQEEFVKFINI